ncbi:MAG TPA: prolyl oligopeptidase family serine peptidase [Polyangiaceae bacterium]
MTTSSPRTVGGIFAGAMTVALATACSESSKGFENRGPGGTAGAGTSGSSGSSGTSGSGTSSGGATSGSGGSAAGGATAGSGNPTAGDGGTTSGSGGTAPRGGAGGSGAGTGGGTAGMAPTMGCTAATWPPGDGMALQTIDVAGTSREYIVQLPAAYEPTHPHRLVFAWHGRTGTATQVARNFYGLENALGASTIFVSGQGLGTESDPADTGWPNTNGQDVAFVRALVTSLSASYCIDSNRVMSVGMSYGGIMSYTLACQMSDVFRAIAPIAGASFGRGGACGTNPVAVWAAHGTADLDVTFMNGETAKNAYVTRNHCQQTGQPVEPQPYCTSYDGCDAGYPVVFCVHDGGHTIPQWTGPAIAAFFQQF